jgi:glycosyltransferase involved in cell wall biosynthesis
MRVLFVQETPVSGRGGSASHAARKVRLLRRIGCSVRVAALSSPSTFGGRLCLIGSYAKTIASLGSVDVVYARLVPRSLPIAWLAALLGIRVILEANGFIPGDRSGVQRLAYLALTRVTRHRSVSLCGDEAFMRYFKDRLPHIRWHRLPLGVDEDEFPPHEVRSSNSPLAIAFGGTLSQEQGIWALTDAVHADPALSRVELWVFGIGPEESALRGYAAHHPNIHLFGQLSPEELRPRLSTAGVLVAPYPSSFRQGYPISVLKVLDYAMTDRVIVVPSRDSLIAELRLGLDDGVLTWAGDSNADLRDTLRSALRLAESGATYPDRRARITEVRGQRPQTIAMAEILGAVDHLKPNSRAAGRQ